MSYFHANTIGVFRMTQTMCTKQQVKDFHEMTADELANYTGPVWTVRCQIKYRLTGKVVAHDFESPTYKMLIGKVRLAERLLGEVVYLEYFESECKPKANQ